MRRHLRPLPRLRGRDRRGNAMPRRKYLPPPQPSPANGGGSGPRTRHAWSQDAAITSSPRPHAPGFPAVMPPRRRANCRGRWPPTRPSRRGARTSPSRRPIRRANSRARAAAASARGSFEFVPDALARLSMNSRVGKASGGAVRLQRRVDQERGVARRAARSSARVRARDTAAHADRRPGSIR